MNDYIKDKNFRKIMSLAHEGVITEAFLDLLIDLRDKHETIKNESEEIIHAEIVKHFENVYKP